MISLLVDFDENETVMIVSMQTTSHIAGDADYDAGNTNVRPIRHLAAFDKSVVV
jgi:hypothetical protein